MTFNFRVRYLKGPAHVFCRLFVATEGGTFAGVGSLTMRHDEFEAFRIGFQAEFIEDKRADG